MLHSNNDMLLDCVAFPQREMKVLTIVKSSIMPLARRGGGGVDGQTNRQTNSCHSVGSC
jgi:hypothetical protein